MPRILRSLGSSITLFAVLLTATASAAQEFPAGVASLTGKDKTKAKFSSTGFIPPRECRMPRNRVLTVPFDMTVNADGSWSGTFGPEYTGGGFFVWQGNLVALNKGGTKFNANLNPGVVGGLDFEIGNFVRLVCDDDFSFDEFNVVKQLFRVNKRRDAAKLILKAKGKGVGDLGSLFFFGRARPVYVLKMIGPFTPAQ